MLNKISNFTGLKSFDMILIITNVLMFIVVQTMFFVKVGTSQYVTTLVSKLKPIKDAIALNQSAQIKLDDYVNSDEWLSTESQIEQENAEQSKKGYSYLIKNLKYPFILCIIILIISIGFFIRSGEFRNQPLIKASLFFAMIVAYSSEILTYVFVMSQWEHVGSLELLKEMIV